MSYRSGKEYSRLAFAATSVLWSSTDENVVFIGTDAGHVIAFDIRVKTKEISTRRLNNNRVNRLKSIGSNNGIAVCSSNSGLNILEETDLATIFKHDTENDVRDIAYSNNKLYLVGPGINKFESVPYEVK